MTWEFEILYWIQAHRSGFLDWFMPRITALGNSGIFFVLLAVTLICIRRTRRVGITMLASIVIGAIIGNLILKNIIARERPCWIDPQVLLLIQNPRDYSFPSGHTLVAFESAVSILQYHRRWGIAALILAVVIACSRLYLFVHFPTDVLAGVVLGSGIALFVGKVVSHRQHISSSSTHTI